MREENMTFGQFLKAKRLASDQELSLRDAAKKLDMSLTMYSDIEKDRRNPGEDFVAKVSVLLGLSKEETEHMHDLAAIKKRMVPTDIEDVMMYTPSGSLARAALRLTNEGVASEEDWKKFIKQLEKKKKGT